MLPTLLDRTYGQMIAEASELLNRSGFVICESGAQQLGCVELCCYTDQGPVDQDKVRNEDFVLAWLPRGEDDDVSWAIAMADGVSSSYFAREAAELVCWQALGHLIASSRASSLVTGEESVSRATESLCQLGTRLRADPESYVPVGDYNSTWAYVLRKGRFLQTTLTLAWECGKEIFLIVVGDGGVVIGNRHNSSVDWISRMTKDSHVVHALGPDKLSGQQLDIACRMEVPATFRLALFTDGLQTAIYRKSAQLWDHTVASVAGDNPAEAMVREWMQTGPTQFDDNLTLALVVRNNRPDTRSR